MGLANVVRREGQQKNSFIEIECDRSGSYIQSVLSGVYGVRTNMMQEARSGAMHVHSYTGIHMHKCLYRTKRKGIVPARMHRTDRVHTIIYIYAMVQVHIHRAELGRTNRVQTNIKARESNTNAMESHSLTHTICTFTHWDKGKPRPCLICVSQCKYESDPYIPMDDGPWMEAGNIPCMYLRTTQYIMNVSVCRPDPTHMAIYPTGGIRIEQSSHSTSRRQTRCLCTFTGMGFSVRHACWCWLTVCPPLIEMVSWSWGPRVSTSSDPTIEAINRLAS